MKLARLLRRDPAAPTLRERAAALREGLSRREAVLGAAVVAAAPIPARAAGTVEAHPDAALIALGQRWAEAYRIERAAAAIWNAYGDVQEIVPPPEAVYVRDGDDALGIARLAGKDRNGRLWYYVGLPGSTAHAGVLREPRRRNRVRPPVPEDNLPADAWGVISGEPWPEAQARADEIVGAWDGWRAAMARHNVVSGHDAAEADWTAKDDVLSGLEDEISVTKAHTLAGLTIKARLAQSLDDRHHRISDDLLFEIIRGLVALDTATA